MIINPHKFLKRLVLWLDPSFGKTGATLSSWLDKSGSNNNASQPTAGSRPTDNTTFITFDGGDNMLIADSGSLDVLDKLTLYARIRTVSATIFQGIFDKFIGSGSGYALFLTAAYKANISAVFSKTTVNLAGTTTLNDGVTRSIHTTIECTRKFFNKLEICSGRQPQWYKEGSIYYLFYDRWDGAQDNIYVRSSTSPYFEGSSETLLISNKHYCSIMKDGSTYRLIVTAPNNQTIQLYTSATVDSGYAHQGTLVTFGDAYDISGLGDPHEIKIGGVYYLYYSGFSAPATATICYATSATGAVASYTKNGTCIGLGAGSDFDINLAADPSPRLMPDGATIMMVYTGYNSTLVKQQQGYATSTDGITWTKSPNGPIHAFTDPSFEAGTNGANEPDILFENGLMRMLYTANNTASGSEKIGIVEFNMIDDSTVDAGNETITTKVYVNNVLENTDVKTGSAGIDYIVPNAHDVFLGGDGVSTFLFNGDLFEAKIWHDIKTVV